MKKYDPNEFWLEQGKHYKADFNYSEPFMIQERALIDFLKTLDFKTVLEVGCGFGRITKLILEQFQYVIDSYVAIDLSADQVSLASASIVNDEDRVSFFVEDFRQSRYDDESFDLVIAAEVLMHIPPYEVQSFVDKMRTLSKRHVINVDMHIEPIPKPESYPPDECCFSHAYSDCKRISIEPDIRQSIFYWQKKQE